MLGLRPSTDEVGNRHAGVVATREPIRLPNPWGKTATIQGLLARSMVKHSGPGELDAVLQFSWHLPFRDVWWSWLAGDGVNKDRSHDPELLSWSVCVCLPACVYVCTT